MKIVRAHQIKRDLMRYAFFERGHIAVVTEGLNHADILGITPKKLAVEFEVKVTKSDLNKELAAIRYATMTMIEKKPLAPVDKSPEQEQLNMELAGLKQKAGGWSKINKHEEYIDPKAYFEKHKRYMLKQTYLPNYFYVAVPRHLADYAVEKLAKTGYGVIAYNGCRSEGQHYGHNEKGEWVSGMPCDFDKRCREEVAVKLKPKLIHSEPVSDTILMEILNRAVTENIRMFDELVAAEKEINKRHARDRGERVY